MGRLLLAHVLRVVVVVCLAVAIVISAISVVGLALATLGKDQLGGAYGAADLALMWGAALAVLLAISRLAYLALGRIVNLRQPKPH